MGNCVEIINQQNKQNQTNQTTDLNFLPPNSIPSNYYVNNLIKSAIQNNQITNENPYAGNPSYHKSLSQPNNYQMYPTQNVMPINTTNAANNVNNQENKNLNDIKKSQKEKDNQAENIRLQKDIIEKQANEKIQMEKKLNNLQTEGDKLKLEQNEKIRRLTAEITQKNQEIFKLKNSYNELLLKYNELIPITVGLNNIGATCYMNATLQSLSNVKELSNYFLHKFIPNDPNKRLSNEYYTVVKNLWDRNNNGRAYSPDSFKNTLSQMNPLFAGIAANDSKDLINFLLETFHTELNKPTAKINNMITPQDQKDELRMFNLFFEEMQHNFQSKISDLFYGVLETQSRCLKCQGIKYNFQIYSFIEFPLEQVYNYCLKTYPGNNHISAGIPVVDLYTCFEHYQLPALMSGDNQIFCNDCNMTFNAYYGTLLYLLPNYLIINLNRGKNAVFQCNVIFPELLKLHKYVLNPKSNTVFKLVSVICHYGPSSMGGHFIAYCRHYKDDCWYNYNDGNVTKCTNQKPYLNGMPYILFYKTLEN